MTKDMLEAIPDKIHNKEIATLIMKSKNVERTKTMSPKTANQLFDELQRLKKENLQLLNELKRIEEEEFKKN